MTSSISIEAIEKEFQYKLQVMKNALLQEKLKNTQLENDIKRFKDEVQYLETELANKDKEFAQLTKAKNESVSKLDRASFRLSVVLSNFPTTNPNKRATLSNISESEGSKRSSQRRSSISFSKIKQACNIFENEYFDDERLHKKRLVPLSSNEYESLIAHYEIQNETLKTQLKEANDTIIDVKDNFQVIYKQKELQVANLTNSQITLNAEILRLKDNIMELQKTLQDEERQKKSLQLKLSEEKFTSQNLSNKISELKFALTKEAIEEKLFTGTKKDVFNKTQTHLLFTNIDDKFILKTTYEDKYTKTIAINEIEHIRILDEKSICIRYFVDSKPKEKSYNLNENPLDFIKTYKYYISMDLRSKLNKRLLDQIK